MTGSDAAEACFWALYRVMELKWCVALLKPYRYDSGKWSLVYVSSLHMFSGRTRAEALLRFRIAHPDVALRGLLDIGAGLRSDTLEELMGKLTEIAE